MIRNEILLYSQVHTITDTDKLLYIFLSVVSPYPTAAKELIFAGANVCADFSDRV